MTSEPWIAFAVVFGTIALAAWVRHLRSGATAILQGYRQGHQQASGMTDPARLNLLMNEALLKAAAARVLGRQVEALTQEGITAANLVRRGDILEGRQTALNDTGIVELRDQLAKRQAAAERMLRAGMNLPGLGDAARSVIEDIARTGRMPDDLEGPVP